MTTRPQPAIRRAFVLGAGLGTRLGQLTKERPKPLIPICQKPLITFAFDHLIGSGISEFVVNTHHQSQVYNELFPDGTYRGIPIGFRHEPVLLETAGGLKNAEELLKGEPFVVYNGDILCDLPLEGALRFHQQQQNEVTLVLRSGGGPLQVALDETSGCVADIGRRRAGAGEPVPAPRFLFTGIYIVEPAFLARIPAGTKLSVVPVFIEMIRAGQKLGGVVIDEGRWWDLGNRESYLAVHRHFLANPGWRAPQPWPIWVHPAAQVAPNATLSGATVIGSATVIGPGATLEDCVVWENAVIAGGAQLRGCIVGAGRHVDGTHCDRDF